VLTAKAKKKDDSCEQIHKKSSAQSKRFGQQNPQPRENLIPNVQDFSTAELFYQDSMIDRQHDMDCNCG
jgi:hypothetical protein